MRNLENLLAIRLPLENAADKLLIIIYRKLSNHQSLPSRSLKNLPSSATSIQSAGIPITNFSQSITWFRIPQ